MLIILRQNFMVLIWIFNNLYTTLGLKCSQNFWKSSQIAKETWIRESEMMKKNSEIVSQIGMNLKFQG
jgi:hypothetical protein